MCGNDGAGSVRSQHPARPGTARPRRARRDRRRHLRIRSAFLRRRISVHRAGGPRSRGGRHHRRGRHRCAPSGAGVTWSWCLQWPAAAFAQDETHDPVMCFSGPMIFGAGVLGGAQADPARCRPPICVPKIPEEPPPSRHCCHGQPRHRLSGSPTSRYSFCPPCGHRPGSRLARCAAFWRHGAATHFRCRPRDACNARPPGALRRYRHRRPEMILRDAGRGADSVIDVGTDASMSDALNAVRPGGTVSAGSACTIFSRFPCPH